MAIEFSITRRVEFSETDLAGIMHFTNFYRWMEICEHEFLRSVGLSVDMEDENGRFGWPRVKTSCRFKRPLRFEEEVEVKLIITEIRDRSITYAFQFWKDEEGEKCSTQWSPFEKDSNYFEPSKKEFMFNYRVENLVELIKTLKEEGVTVVGEIEEFDYGKFGWILDNEDNKIELWEPVDQAFL